MEVVPNEPWENPRLSPDALPYLYNLLLHPNLRTSIFKGKVTISLNIKSVHEHLAVHVKGLQITKTELTVDDEVQTIVKLRDTFEFKKNEFWVIVPEQEIQPGKYKLLMEFDGKLTNKIVGFYQSVYKNDEGEERRIATTKFEPTFARQAFPCFDEPNFKAKYNIELVKPSANYIALSNMNKIGEEVNKPETGLTTVKFATSLPMSTYLACFIICDFDHLEPAFTEKGFPITVYARKEYVEDVAYAKNVALIATNFYVKYFNIDYPLPKLDLIAIPDFVSGAMENWGLITFRETRLLCASGNASVGNRLAVALTVSHEIAHMWFGDLVTMKWWNDLWLNEGFATFVEYKATAQVHPDWELDNIFVSQELYPVLKLDSTLSSHPIVQPVSHPDQITEIFDSISYNKGASVLRMLEATLGEESFCKGITSYMNKFRYSNAETQDLWNHLNEFSSDINVTTFMGTWTRQMGFPLISVRIEGKKITFTQKRYLIDPSAEYDKSESPFNYRWEIPITFITSPSKTIHKIWMKHSEEQVVYNLPAEVAWIKVNYHNIGYYMVNYELSVWNKLIEMLIGDFKSFDPADRAELLHEVFSLAESEEIPYDVALRMTQYLSKDTHYTPWSVACSQFLLLNRRLYGTGAYIPFMKYVNSLIKGMKIMTWELDERDNYLTKSYQNNILHLGCLVGNTMCLNQTANLFRQWLSIPAMKLNPELVQIIQYFGVQQTGTQEWEQLWDLYLKEDNPQDKVKMMKALCASRDATVLKKYMQLGKNESYVRSQDYLTLLAALSQNPTANPLVWDFVREEWEFLVNRYTINDRYLGRLVSDITYHFGTESRLQQMKTFFQKYPDGGAGTSARKIALERVANNIKWRNKHVTLLTEWFTAVTA